MIQVLPEWRALQARASANPGRALTRLSMSNRRGQQQLLHGQSNSISNPSSRAVRAALKLPPTSTRKEPTPGSTLNVQLPWTPPRPFLYSPPPLVKPRRRRRPTAGRCSEVET